MLGGLFNRWKIPVAYHFTPNNVNGSLLKEIVEQLIQKAECTGLYVHSVTSDMGPVNLSMWRAFGGISYNRHSQIRHYIPHPVDNNRKIFFIADAPHLLKNLKAALLNNKVMELPAKFLETYKLSHAVVKCDHLNELIEVQENLQFKFIPKIKKQDMKCTTFNKMKVDKATNLWSRNVSSAMNFYAEEQGKKEFNTTATFIEVISKWFTLVTARTPRVALGLTTNNKEKETKFKTNIAFLQSIVELFQDIKIGQKLTFKPVQNGIIITTSSIIELTQYLMHERKYVYLC